MKRLFAVALATVAVVGCADGNITGVQGSAHPAFGAAQAATHVTVMTRNMYVGAPVEPILVQTDPLALAQAVADAWEIVLATDVAGRIGAMADEIARARPDLVGLQEVSLFRTQFPGDVFLGNPVPNATDVAFDFLAMLLDALSERGVTYGVASQIQNVDVEVPRLDGFQGGFPVTTDIRLTDADVLLARADVEISNSASGNYFWALPAPAGIDVTRGWAAVDATLHGTTFRVFSTHLEAEAEVIRFLQAQELVTMLAGETRPLLVLGDLNTGPGRPADQGGQATYDFLLGQGYVDLWTAQSGPADDGFTCCHAGDLSNTVPTLVQRIDLILARNIAALGPASGWTITQLDVIGDEAKDLRKAGLWASDHAAVVARLVLPSPGLAD